LGKVAGEWRSLVLIKDALSRHRRLLEMPVAEMVNRCAQEQAFPIAKLNASIFERSEGFLQTAAGMRTPKVAIKIRILTQRLFAHWSRMGPPVEPWKCHRCDVRAGHLRSTMNIGRWLRRSLRYIAPNDGGIHIEVRHGPIL
jgi:hypothetical protein